ncbi:MAG TPA: arsenic resistance N-acetyltransferase ArsN2 [Gemmatimonadaceae bacterium]|nr:arsenic resistance N-acetyltransferase ArsN2 [Gemmatimonadaceae bacterium]
MSNTPTHSIEIGAASKADLEHIERLLSACKLPVEGVSELVDSFLVARADGKLAGLAAIERCGAYGLLRSVAVEPVARSEGVGRALVDRLIADAREKRVPALYLLTTTAEKYFTSFGFRTIDRTEVPNEIQSTSEFRDLCPSSATVMRLSL